MKYIPMQSLLLLTADLINFIEFLLFYMLRIYDNTYGIPLPISLLQPTHNYTFRYAFTFETPSY
jgi:hypothetical protein